MNPNAVRAWLGQATTGAGVAALLGTLGAVASGQMTWQQATPLLAAAVVGLIWPENKPVAQGASTLAADLIQWIPLITAAVEHGRVQSASSSIGSVQSAMYALQTTPTAPAAPAEPPKAA